MLEAARRSAVLDRVSSESMKPRSESSYARPSVVKERSTGSVPVTLPPRMRKSTGSSSILTCMCSMGALSRESEQSLVSRCTGAMRSRWALTRAVSTRMSGSTRAHTMRSFLAASSKKCASPLSSSWRPWPRRRHSSSRAARAFICCRRVTRRASRSSSTTSSTCLSPSPIWPMATFTPPRPSTWYQSRVEPSPPASSESGFSLRPSRWASWACWARSIMFMRAGFSSG
mmetsp:Transcript_4432/g.14762  ORF Transcript_4432/g.14762 Transcript_4432/m.14762 type:complete len:229 (-) Transcript_4432:55-741(-)